MAITITNIQRVNANPCQHWEVTINEDGITRQKVLSQDEMEASLEDFPGGYKGALVLGWIRYARQVKGLTIAQMVGQVVIS